MLMQLIELIVVALILIVEVADVVRHWNDNQKDTILFTSYRGITDDCVCIERVTIDNPDTKPCTEEDGDSSGASANADSFADDSGLYTDADTHTARAFLSDSHRHVRQPVKYNRHSMR